MECISNNRCYIGEGPVWNRKERLLYHVHPAEKEIRTISLDNGETKIIKCPIKINSLAFDADGEMYVATPKGVFYFKNRETLEPIYDTEKYSISYCNDMKAGPDGRLYVGTQSSKARGLSDDIDGKLYSIDGNGNVNVLLDGLILSNGLDWSPDGKLFYHTDSATKLIREYELDEGRIRYTGREVKVRGIDGLTVDKNGNIIAASWGHSKLTVVDPVEFKIIDSILVPTNAPASCAFAGDDMKTLIVVTAYYGIDITKDTLAGFTFAKQMEIGGIEPYYFQISKERAKNEDQ